ncbi:Zinc finger BED domain-containing protein [Quillaja saponaria]|uniref:Zinc finger BED domain-containing protein n=1 Tax=Quillaja saponaria TaxID=32244 RepID=A0AAD7VIF5_QUISA|nr:Zinc finger BED domain-containing protein [Quillaja saponaria]
MSKNLVDAPLPSVEESITGPLLLDHEMDSTQGDPIEIDDDEEDTDEGIPDKKRKKKSQVWLEFKEIEVGDGTKKAECMHCKQRLKYAGTTSQLKRHLDNTCTRRKIALRSQRMLNVVPVAPGISKGESSDISTFQYDNAKVRDSIANFILVHEHSFSIVEEEFFTMMMKTCSPLYQKITRNTAKADCMAIYEREKKKLKTQLKNVNKISLTTDLWRSGQEIEYMVVIGHFIDSNWNLQKRVLSFVDVPPPRGGVDIADALFKCMTEWSIESKVFSVSVDNASYNDVAINVLKDTFSRRKHLLLGGKLFHVRCTAHILNLLVQAGLSAIGDVIENVRASVKFLKNSESRLLKFSEIIQQLKLSSRKLILDCPTRWNSTYEMLTLALQFKDAFPLFQKREPHYKHLPSVEDWNRVELVCEVLEVFSVSTKMISGSEYPTSNLFLSEIYRVKEVLEKKTNDQNIFMKEMIMKMRAKFDKYWGECNLLMAFGAILDPRCKMRFIEFCFPLIYPKDEVTTNIASIRGSLYELYNEYATLLASNVDEHNEEVVSQSTGTSSGSLVSSRSLLKKNSAWSQFDQFVQRVETVQPEKSDLDVYLEEGVFRCADDPYNYFDALNWWKANSLKYRVLSLMACDILAIPITTVASESTFSAGGRVIDTYRASLSTDTVQALVCGGDWVRHKFGIKKKPRKRDNTLFEEEVVITIP